MSTFSPQQVAERYGVDHFKVLRWINSGQLAAVNVATSPKGRPRWRISEEALADFERRRSNMPAPTTSRRRKSAAVEPRYY